jgi:hypothetical protein
MGKTDAIYIAVVNSSVEYNAPKGIRRTHLVGNNLSTSLRITEIMCKIKTLMATMGFRSCITRLLES